MNETIAVRDRSNEMLMAGLSTAGVHQILHNLPVTNDNDRQRLTAFVISVLSSTKFLR